MNAMFENSRAFEPMFDEKVVITAPRGNDRISGSFRACVMPLQLDDPFAEMDAASTRKRLSVLVANHGENAWLESALGSRPQIGDIIETRTGFKAAVTKVNPLVDSWFELEAREC